MLCYVRSSQHRMNTQLKRKHFAKRSINRLLSLANPLLYSIEIRSEISHPNHKNFVCRLGNLHIFALVSPLEAKSILVLWFHIRIWRNENDHVKRISNITSQRNRTCWVRVLYWNRASLAICGRRSITHNSTCFNMINSCVLVHCLCRFDCNDHLHYIMLHSPHIKHSTHDVVCPTKHLLADAYAVVRSECWGPVAPALSTNMSTAE